jgi:hypothetical protein
MLFVIGLVAFLLALGTLMAGGAWLGKPTVLFSIPAGNLVAWVMMVALPLAAWPSLRQGALRRAAAMLILLGAFWLPMSILLAGNVSLNFQRDGLALAWMVYSGACLLLPVVLLAARAARQAWTRRD